MLVRGAGWEPCQETYVYPLPAAVAPPTTFWLQFLKTLESATVRRGGEWRPVGSLAQPRAKPGQTLPHSCSGKTPGSGPRSGRPHGEASSTRPWSQRPPGLYSPAPSRPSCDPTHMCPGPQAPASRLTRGTLGTAPSPGTGVRTAPRGPPLPSALPAAAPSPRRPPAPRRPRSPLRL